MKNHWQNLKEDQNKDLPNLLQKFKQLFNGTLGTWKTDPVYFELKENYKLICSRLYPVPNLHEEIFKKEVECLFLMGVIKS